MIDHAAAADRLERACDFAGAAREALLAGDPRRSARLAALAGDHSALSAAIDAIGRGCTKEEAESAAMDLLARGFGCQAGELLERLERPAEAGAAFAAGGNACRAAECYERAGKPAEAARVLEALLRTDPRDAKARLLLGELLARHHRPEPAVRTLQLLDPHAVERRLALPLLARCLSEMGLAAASALVREEMSSLGIAEVSAEATPPAIPEQRLLGRYRVLQEVAATPHARVLRAVDELTGNAVALKLLTGGADASGRDAIHRFQREAVALGQLRHPCIVPLCAYHPELPALSLSWMPGGTLSDLLLQGPLSPTRAVEIALSVLAALGEAHRLGILHRDVKPSNILFDDVGAARLSDFGAAHLGDRSTTVTASAIGTMAYMSPEQREGRPATVASDIFGVGAVLVEAISGVIPQVTPTQLEALPVVCHPELGTNHQAIMARMIHVDPSQRPRDAFEARRLLTSVGWPLAPASRRQAPSSIRPAVIVEQRLADARSVGDARDVHIRHRDTWLGRDVWVLSATSANLDRARAFATVGHPVLPTVLRVDPSRSTLWVEAPRGVPLSKDPEPLQAEHLEALRDALEALHAVGAAHGHVDPEHVFRSSDEICLSFPLEIPDDGDLEQDRAGLASLMKPRIG